MEDSKETSELSCETNGELPPEASSTNEPEQKCDQNKRPERARKLQDKTQEQQCDLAEVGQQEQEQEQENALDEKEPQEEEEEEEEAPDEELDCDGAAGRKMFVGGLSWQTGPDGLRDHFGQFGQVTEVMIMNDPATRRSR